VYYGDFVNEIKAASLEELLETVKLKYRIETNSEIKLTFWSEKHQEWIKFKEDLPDDISKIKILTECK
jgi:acyl-CoA thioesterase